LIEVSKQIGFVRKIVKLNVSETKGFGGATENNPTCESIRIFEFK
jgi:hypothetical protein